MTGALRLGRGLIVSALIVIVSAAFHTAGGGCLDHLSSLGFFVLCAATLAGAVALSAREWTLPRLIALVAVAQLGFHLLFEVVDNLGENDSHIAIASGAEHRHSFSMLLAHVPAALVIAALLRCGERRLLAFITVLAGLLPQPIALPGHPIRSTTVVPPQAPKESGLRRILFMFLLTHRGPPLSRAALAAA